MKATPAGEPAPPESPALEPTRDPGSENFPVASWLLSREVRPKVLGFYRFVRAADDIGDHPDLTPAQKLARLDALEAALDDPATAVPEAVGLHAAGAGTEEARSMLSAFRQDASQGRYADWAELQGYCARSAAPVGRMLLRLHGEDPALHPAADALCEALQILNHLQDLVPDRAALDRVYLPVPWMDEAGGEAAFFAPGTDRRPVLDAALDRVEEALDRASGLARGLRSRRLALETAVTLGCARTLLARLRAADPVAGRVALTKGDFARALAAAPRLGPSDAALVRARVARSGSSFARGMAALRGERRRALWAVYAFCRAVDDIADGAMPLPEKRLALAQWRAKLAAPDCALSRELAWARARFALPVAECEAMIAGMETDSAPRLRLPDEAALDLYCRRVAGSVGAMAVRIFGEPRAEGFGLALGRTFQLVNILRDLDEDATRDRVYLPLSLLGGDGTAGALLASPALPRVAAALARRARDGFRAAEAELAGLDARAMRPARVMMWGYARLLDRLIARGFARRGERPRLAPGEKARMAWFALTGRLPASVLPDWRDEPAQDPQGSGSGRPAAPRAA
ncbi:squalene/phytoene synthase family protein [Roseomonas sp. OT10]|uniref:squalene/phytoene synthase family protein n=1 Tax=Roseomonas cutis TaxID=2897332 RepID=UPI001E5FF999|nr:squalene/phytoene synthase family protein [Roseomonas sp. OT10]UFN49932.1 squalene/phytoene synthase family protein [Roseomonas sp. OT10]